MIEVFNQKIIISGSEIEHYVYKDKSILRGYRRSRRKKRKENEETPKAKSKFSLNRTRTKIRRIVNANPQLIKFLTLTTEQTKEMTNLQRTNRLFNLFTQRIRYRHLDFQYFAVPEYQKDVDFYGRVKPFGGTIHYHVVCNLPYIEAVEIAKIWKNGTIDIKKRKKKIKNVGQYLSKYLQKDVVDERFFGKKKYFCSQNLNKPVELVGDKAAFFMQEGADNLELKWSTKFDENEYRGEVLYSLYNFKPPIS